MALPPSPHYYIYYKLLVPSLFSLSLTAAFTFEVSNGGSLTPVDDNVHA